MKNITLLIKPASGICNMSCKYCFYRDLTLARSIKSYGMMSKNTADNLIAKSLSAADKSVNFAFQGGEPTLAGLDFYEYFVSKVDELNTANLHINYSIQTNGLVVDEKWTAFFKRHNFLVGISLDGTRDIHDYLRQDLSGRGTYTRVMKAVSLLKKYGVDFNILTVLTSNIARHIKSVYRTYKNEGFSYLQFTVCLDELGDEPFKNKYSLTSQLYADFLITLFDLYIEDLAGGKFTSIRYFDNLLDLVSGKIPEMCGLCGYCSGQFVIEGDGSVFPCDFYCTDSWLTGNINQDSLRGIFESEPMQRFIKMSAVVAEPCKTCGVYNLCRGGCRRYRALSESGPLGENIYCEAYKKFFTYAAPRLTRLAAYINQ